ncbi:hypothetical protein [Rubritalea tangerina]|uniref:hypothetical protein n=1 Tax=Rubritalea tangerina TaxID=430798 RepID=UPI00360BE312
MLSLSATGIPPTCSANKKADGGFTSQSPDQQAESADFNFFLLPTSNHPPSCSIPHKSAPSSTQKKVTASHFEQ